MSRLKTISDKLDYIAMGKLNAEQMEYICEIDQEVNLKDKEIERLQRQKEELQVNGLRQETLFKLEIERLNKDLEKSIEICNNRQKEIVRLNNIINKEIEAINVYQNEKTLSVGYQDLKRIKGILQGNEFDLQMFEEYLQELKGSDSNE